MISRYSVMARGARAAVLRLRIMIRKIALPTLMLLAVAGLALVALTWLPGRPASAGLPRQSIEPASPANPAPAVQSPCTNGTTIRNVTDRTIMYTICPEGRPEALQIRRIAPNAIDCFPTVSQLEIEFHEGGKEVSYSLDAGKPYAFRYEDGTRIGLFLGSHGRSDVVDLAPYVPTPDEVVDKMLELSGVTARDVVYDIGCGDGRIVIAAARKYGVRGVGIDLDKKRIDESIANARKAGVERLVRFICEDATRADVSEATVVTLYLLSESNALLRPMLEKQLRPGSRVVSHNYAIAGWEDKQVVATSVRDGEGKSHSIFVYAR
jgi:SAM-dependent methyltransferase